MLLLVGCGAFGKKPIFQDRVAGMPMGLEALPEPPPQA